MADPSELAIEPRSRGRLTLLAVAGACVVVLLAVVIVDRANTGSELRTMPSSPAGRLEAAIEQTLAVKSMVITSSVAPQEDEEGAGGESGSVSEYVAPDRFRTTTVGGGEVRIIANVTYFQAGVPGWLSRTGTPGRPIGPLMELHVLRNPDEVSGAGDELTVRLRGDQGTATVEIRGGFVVRIEHTIDGGAEPFTAVSEFSKFNEPVNPIEAPPADQVTEVSEQPGGDHPPERREATLPPPTGSTESTVQMRGVLSDSATGCASPPANPAPESPARLTNFDDTCYDLDVSDLELTSVKEIKAYEDEGGMVSVDITVRDDDADRFDALARKHMGGQLALVAFGRVLMAPEIQTEAFGGRISISSITPELASRLIAALT